MIGTGEFGVGYRVHDSADSRQASANVSGGVPRLATLFRNRWSSNVPPVCSSAFALMDGCASWMADATSCERSFGRSWFPVLYEMYVPRSSGAPAPMNDCPSAVSTESQHAAQLDQGVVYVPPGSAPRLARYA